MNTYDFTASENFIAGAPISVLQGFAMELNRGWPVFAHVFQALETDGLPGEEVDHLMEGVFIVWHATIKTKRRKLPTFTVDDIQRHVREFADFATYYQCEAETEERHSLRFIHHPQLEAFTAARLQETYGEPERVPSHVSALYFAVMKCFDNVIAATPR